MANQYVLNDPRAGQAIAIGLRMVCLYRLLVYHQDTLRYICLLRRAEHIDRVSGAAVLDSKNK